MATLHADQSPEELAGLSWRQQQQPRADVAGLAARSTALCDKHPLYPGFRGFTTYVA